MQSQTLSQRHSVLLLVSAALLGCIASVSSGCHWASGSQNAVGARLYQQGQYTAAMQQFQRAINTSPTNPDGYYNFAVTTHRLGVQRKDPAMLSRAEALYNQCLDHAPDHIDCHRGLAVLLVDTGRSNKAFSLMKNWASRNPHNADARIELARLYEEFGDPATCKKYLEDSVELDPNNSRGWLALGRNRESSGDYTQALANYQRSLALNNLQPAATERVAALSRRMADQYDASLSQGRTRLAQPSTRPINSQRY